MAIILKPSNITRGVASQFTLLKTNLISNHVVSANPRFSDFSNWSEVYINYKSSEGNQRTVVNFDADTNFQTGEFFVSQKARSSFIVESMIIVDLDGEVLKIQRSDLNTLDFDINFNDTSNSEEFVLLLENGSEFILESGEFLSL